MVKPKIVSDLQDAAATAVVGEVKDDPEFEGLVVMAVLLGVLSWAQGTKKGRNE